MLPTKTYEKSGHVSSALRISWEIADILKALTECALNTMNTSQVSIPTPALTFASSPTPVNSRLALPAGVNGFAGLTYAAFPSSSHNVFDSLLNPYQPVHHPTLLGRPLPGPQE